MALTDPGPLGHTRSVSSQPLDDGGADVPRFESDPMSRMLDAALDLAWFEAAGKPLDDEELRVLNCFDEIAHVRAQIDSSNQRPARPKPVPGGQRPLA